MRKSVDSFDRNTIGENSQSCRARHRFSLQGSAQRDVLVSSRQRPLAAGIYPPLLLTLEVIRNSEGVLE